MRIILLFLAAALLAGCMPTSVPEQYGALPRVPCAACGDMAALRNNLTAAPYPSPWSDADLHALGVRCLGEPIPQPSVRARY
ncbi:MAG TPA: hypothetical protein VMI72_14930 [Roseiarcus sp.]|nr:hypothetical protein [Roseiarcus sp.]